jgi:hypothetical protein
MRIVRAKLNKVVHCELGMERPIYVYLFRKIKGYYGVAYIYNNSGAVMSICSEKST